MLQRDQRNRGVKSAVANCRQSPRCRETLRPSACDHIAHAPCAGATCCPLVAAPVPPPAAPRLWLARSAVRTPFMTDRHD
ncbi:hypothetical protein EVAR_8927_1 [Eumeta japonica]|uniref:Uncharacterized protein n=1 Tax=Eumeta variegata TaxID=151549 RepID=A0A4C1U0P4_EUMVA|nr:hypothetical protein EVAR_8927_1 [Eumeta japonica]